MSSLKTNATIRDQARAACLVAMGLRGRLKKTTFLFESMPPELGNKYRAMWLAFQAMGFRITVDPLWGPEHMYIIQWDPDQTVALYPVLDTYIDECNAIMEKIK